MPPSHNPSFCPEFISGLFQNLSPPITHLEFLRCACEIPEQVRNDGKAVLGKFVDRSRLQRYAHDKRNNNQPCRRMVDFFSLPLFQNEKQNESEEKQRSNHRSRSASRSVSPHTSFDFSAKYFSAYLFVFSRRAQGDPTLLWE